VQTALLQMLTGLESGRTAPITTATLPPPCSCLCGRAVIVGAICTCRALAERVRDFAVLKAVGGLNTGALVPGLASQRRFFPIPRRRDLRPSSSPPSFSGPDDPVIGVPFALIDKPRPLRLHSSRTVRVVRRCPSHFPVSSMLRAAVRTDPPALAFSYPKMTHN